ncbi:D-alanyl-D-alanine carboxypeptidase [Streptomyces sp. NPDC020719]|uniref:D-alanyl-D-alanine carboxypeptidase n=1 Tax=Streptomyces sp. NPDC020719 TaxID=3154896 RepID=UPI0033C0C832
MAGESPDRSKQQQSSGETTPGERDPRVAVFGAGDGPARPSGSPVDAAESVNGSANRSTNGSSNGSSKGGSSNGTVSGKAGTNGSANSSANGSANGSVSGSVNGSANGSAPDLAEDGGSASASASASVDQATAVFRAPRQEDAESRDTRLRAAVAAWVATDGDPEDGDTPSAEDGAKAASGPAEPDDVRESVPAPAAGPGDEPKPKQEADAKPKPDADAEPVASAKPDVESEPDADAEPVTEPEPVASAKPDSDSEPDAEPKAEAEPTPKAEAEPAVEPKADAKPKADEAKAEPDARPKAEKPAAAAKTAPAAPKADDDASDATAEDGEADTDADKPAARAASWGAKLSPGSEVDGADADKSDDKNDDKGGDAVDQPTTVFKAVRPPVVDQPTTAIRLPSKGKGAGKPESESEQTSTFVPLRSDDVRPAAKATEARAGGEAKATNAAAPYVKTPTSPRIQVPDAAPALPEAAERTRQQPLPPKPPLDLLAELTNTPPPAQTPVRTVVRRFKIWTPLVILLLVVFAVVQYVRPLPDPALKMTSAAEYTFDGAAPQLPWPTEGQGLITVSGLGTVGRFGEEKPVPIASVTKSMTAYIIMRDHPMKPGSKGASIPVDKLAEKEGGYNKTGDESTVDTIKAGQNLSQKDALSAVMIPSANNVARLLARWDAGSEAAFVKKMNDTAKELGMTNTTYTDPSGLNATTVSTAVDQVKLATELVKMPALVDITKQPSWTDPSGKAWRNYNTLVPYNGAIGIKTGSTTKAGGNLLFAATKDVGGTKQTIVGAVLSQHKGVSILDTVNKVSKDVLIDTRKSLTSATVIKKDTVVGYVDDGLGGKTPVVATKDLTVAGWPGLRTTIALTATGAKVPHSAKAGTVVGQLTVGSGAGQVSAPVALQKALAEPGFGSKLTRLG